MPEQVGAFYDGSDNSINFNNETLGIWKETIESKQMKLHETIHYLAGKTYNFIMNTFAKAIVEGTTENLVIDSLLDNSYRLEYVREKSNQFTNIIKNQQEVSNIRKAKLEYNFSQIATYENFVW